MVELLLHLGTIRLVGDNFEGGTYDLRRNVYHNLLIPSVEIDGKINTKLSTDLALLINNMTDGMSCYPLEPAVFAFSNSRVSEVFYALPVNISFGIDATNDITGPCGSPTYHPSKMTWTEFCQKNKPLTIDGTNAILSMKLARELVDCFNSPKRVNYFDRH